MLQFVIGVVVGAVVSFSIFAICSIAGTSDRTDIQCTKKTGEENAPNE